MCLALPRQFSVVMSGMNILPHPCLANSCPQHPALVSAESGRANLPGVPGVHSGLTPHLLAVRLRFWTWAEWLCICIQHRLLAELCWSAMLHLLPPPTAGGYRQGDMGGLVILIASFHNSRWSELARER